MALCVLLSNNPAFFQCRRPTLAPHPIEGSAWDVLVAGRDRIHAGWSLLNHPLYGNFQPGQQPFRSLLLREPDSPEASPAPTDATSLHLIEEALGVYRAAPGRGISPDAVPQRLFADASLIDAELLRATLDAVCPC